MLVYILVLYVSQRHSTDVFYTNDDFMWKGMENAMDFIFWIVKFTDKYAIYNTAHESFQNVAAHGGNLLTPMAQWLRLMNFCSADSSRACAAGLKVVNTYSHDFQNQVINISTMRGDMRKAKRPV